MSASSPPAATPLFIPLARFQEYGLPGKTTAYRLRDLGQLDLRQYPGGKVGVTYEEARRFVAAARPAAEAGRDTTEATKASVASPKREAKAKAARESQGVALWRGEH